MRTSADPLTWRLPVAVIVTVIIFGGCGGGGSSGDQAGKVALVDLEQVAQALGREAVLAAYASGDREIQGRGPGAPPDETAAAADDPEQQQRQMRAGLIRNFRAEVRPAARRVAQQQGMSIVLIRRDDVVLYTARNNDITEKVIDQLQGQAQGGAGGGGASGGGGSGSGSGAGGGGGSGSGNS